MSACGTTLIPVDSLTKFLAAYETADSVGRKSMRKTFVISVILLIVAVSALVSWVGGLLNANLERLAPNPNQSLSAGVTSSASPSAASDAPKPKRASATPSSSAPTEGLSTKPLPAALTFEQLINPNCKVGGCIQVQVNAATKCRALEVQIDVYDENDDWIDSYSETVGGIRAGQVKQFELTSDEYEDWQLDVVDVVCLS